MKKPSYTVTIAGGDDQQAEQGRDFAGALQARVVRSGATAAAGTEVESRVEEDSDDAPASRTASRSSASGPTTRARPRRFP
ncbi:hypothetical protein ACH3WN_15135 [Streptomyces albogriseolus]|uniref:hypothetical protein n=1 Tax=Streptomyces albogriseolus TaxID=1887 RepID=UPI0037A78FD7